MRWQKPKVTYIPAGLEIGAYRSPSDGSEGALEPRPPRAEPQASRA